VELAEHAASPVRWNDEAGSLGVDEGHDGHTHLGVGKINAADAAIILSGHSEVVIVRELLGVTGRLEGSHHELVIAGDLLLLALLLFHGGDLVLDLVQINLELFRPFLASFGSLNTLLDDSLGSEIRVTSLIDARLLDDGKSDFLDTSLALLVVDLEITLGSLSGGEHVLVEFSFEGRVTLRAAHPGLDLGSLLKSCLLLEIYSLFTDHQNFLVFHVVSVFTAVELRLDEVLDLSLRLSLLILVSEHQAGWDPAWQDELKADGVVTCLDHLGGIPDLLLVVHEFMCTLQLLAMFLPLRIFFITMVLHPETFERVLGATFDLELDVLSGLDVLLDTKVDCALNGLAWLIEWVLGGHLHVAILVLGIVVLEKFHLSFI